MQGTIIFFNYERRFGRIQPDDGAAPLFVHTSGLSDPQVILHGGERVEFEVEEQPEKGPKAVQVSVIASASANPVTPMARNCFVVMPFGRTAEEIRWFSGWYRLVIEEGVRAAGFEPVLAAAQDRPDAINDEIRAHLAYDPMVVIDLGGATPDTEPNPNVMYELGIRHALNLPHVIMAWAGQRLPFDISNQRTIMERRDLIDVPINRERLTKFIKEAALGNYYRPMDAVGRVATLELAERRLGTGSVLGALVEEVRDLRARLTSPRPYTRRVPLKQALGGKGERKLIRGKFLAAGGTVSQWDKLLQERVDQNLVGVPNKLDLLLEIAKKRFPALVQEQPQTAPPEQQVSDLEVQDGSAIGSDDPGESGEPDSEAFGGEVEDAPNSAAPADQKAPLSGR